MSSVSSVPAVHSPRSAQVSVVIPLFNHEKYIEATLTSVFSQTLPPFEIIVVDDGSTDASAEIVRRIAYEHPEVIFWSSPNQGAHHALNAAILRATGEYVAILNSDDSYHPDRLMACVTATQEDTRIDIVATGVSFIDNDGNAVTNPWYDNAIAFYHQECDLALSLFRANFLVSTSNLFIRRSAFERIGYFAPLRYTHDLEFCLRLILGNGRLQFLDRSLLAYRMHQRNTIAEDKIRGDLERAAVLAFFLHQLGLRDQTGEKQKLTLARFVGVLGEQQLIETVEEFLRMLDTGFGTSGDATAHALPLSFREFLSRLGVNWVDRGSRDPILKRYIAERIAYLDERAREQREHIETLVADKQWLVEQRDAWEKEARAEQVRVESLSHALQEQQARWAEALEDQARSSSKALDDQASSWAKALEDQANSWALELDQQAKSWARELDEQSRFSARVVEELRVANRWLSEQRESWEREASAQEARVKELQRAIEELEAGKEWLDGQRKAWEAVATASGEEVAKCHAALGALMENRLFRFLVSARLMEIKHLPSGPQPPR